MRPVSPWAVSDMADRYAEGDGHRLSPIGSDGAPGVIAYNRSRVIADQTATPEEQAAFTVEFGQVFQAARRNIDTYTHWRRIQGNSFLVAAYIEAVSAARRKDLP